ncbi:PREDICTED: zinc finger protein 385C isoform X4 [Gavialis gangeticus]|uniref:zinc finger protein 385C isoform X4 n=1 Tax=Gavialis gangeticus TaxID=94835 RepID=UPI00092F0DA1|nr:PREDICTED: zinc finger protein 385C isoform X4 [Gavialis gangeticus]
MKRPLSPSHHPENGIRLVETASCPPTQSEQRMKREKKHQSFTLCEVCNIQLNSAAQAQIHYNGKSHQKRLKQLNKGKGPMSQGPSGHNSPLLTSLPIPGRPLHPPLDIKHFLTFRLNGTSPLNLFPNFNTMDPVQKAVINHTFGVPSPLKKKQFISCNICHLRFNSAGSCIHLRQGVNLPSSKYSGLQLGLISSAAGQICHWNQAEAHYKGHKHARRLKAIEAMKNKQKIATATATTSQEKPADFPATLDGSGDPSSTELSEGASDATSVASSAAQGAEPQATELASSVSSAPDSEKDGKKSKPHLYCPTCKVTVNSLSQLEAHNTGAKHKSMLEGHTTQMRRGRGKVLSRAGHKSKRIGNKGSINIQNKAFHCQVCEIYVNSETQLKQHMNSRRHKDRLAGKPPKPKYSPYNKLQKNAALAVSILKSKLALQKHLTKTLATRFLPSPLTTAAVCAMPSPLALRPAAATTLFQAPILGPALFRTPPGHVRATPGPIVFAPY